MMDLLSDFTEDWKKAIEHEVGFRTGTHPLVRASTGEGGALEVRVTEGEKIIAAFSLQPLIGIPVVYSEGAFVAYEFRKKGVGSYLLGIRESFCRKAGVKVMLASVNKQNATEQSLLAGAGWTRFL